MQTENPTPATRPFMSGPELNATPAELLPSALSLNEARRRPSSYRPPSIYTRPDRQRARIAPLRRSPISSFTIFSTLPMASDEPFSGILPGWVARRALRIRARPLGASPTSLGPTEPVAAPSRRVVQQLAAPVQLDEEWRVAPRRHSGEHTGTGAIAAASYHATSVCGGCVSRVCERASRACSRASRAGGNAMQAETEAGCVESDELVASFSVSAVIIEEK